MVKFRYPITIGDLAELLGASFHGRQADADVVLHGVASIEKAQQGEVTFVANPIYQRYLADTQASAVLLLPDSIEHCPTAALASSNPRLALVHLMKLCEQETLPSEMHCHPSAVIGKGCTIAPDVSIGPNCSIGQGVILASGVKLEPGVVIGDRCCIGANTQLKANVTLNSNVTIGLACIIHSGAVIGSDGFGYANDEKGHWVKMPHVGGVKIGNFVEIGSNTSIDKGFIEDTQIADHVIIDNLVQIAHNVCIGENTAIAGCVGIAGSTVIGRNCLIGGGSSIAGHLTITDKVFLTGTSAVNRSITQPGSYSSGLPIKESHIWRKNIARFQTLDKMAKRLRGLEKQFSEYQKVKRELAD